MILVASVPTTEGTDLGRTVAPGELELVRAFLNTVDAEEGDDHLDSTDRAVRWLRDYALISDGDTIGKADLAMLRDVRTGLRALAAANNGHAASERALEPLRRQARRCSVSIDVADGPKLTPGCSGAEGAAARLLAVVHHAQVEGHWNRLKICPADTCQWAFYDRSKNRSGTWCVMAVCGNRAKARAYRSRKASTPT